MSEGSFNFPEKRIHVVKVPRISYQKRNNYTIIAPNGTRMPANRQMARNVSRPFGFVGVDSNPSILNTTLEEYVSNPYYRLDIEDVPPRYRPRGIWESKWDTIKASPKITKQMFYEILDGVPEGHYSSVRKMPLMTSPIATSKTFQSTEPSFLEIFKIHLHEGTNVFANDTQRGRLGILVCENNPKIASSKDVINENFHDFYIASEEEVLAEAERRDNRFMEVVVRLNSVINDYDQFVSYQFAISCRAVKSNVPMAQAVKALREYVMDSKRINGTNQEDRWNEFNRVYAMFKESPKNLYAFYLIRQAYITQLFRNVNGEILWVTQKGRDNWFNLGVNEHKLLGAMVNSMTQYDPDITDDNMFHTLESEIAAKGIATQ